MKTLFRSPTLSVGLAMFAMFFGAGNVIFPLVVGQYASGKNGYAIAGLILTAAIMPIVGAVAMILFEGSYRQFFGRLGRWPGFFLALAIISLLGPLGSTPRCIALAYGTLHGSFSGLSPTLFSALSCAAIFLFTLRKHYILNLLGWVLTPLLLISLVAIIVMGWMAPSSSQSVDQTSMSLFWYGLKEGYNTMDLLAAFFFSSTILGLLRARGGEKNSTEVKTALYASLIGAFLLAAIYVGFSYLAAFHAQHLGLVSKEGLLAAITMKIAGAHGGLFVCTTIALACLTTAIALISAFTDFMHKEVFKEKISYEGILIGGLAVTFFVSTFEFTGISAFLGPILQVCYPGLIVLTILNIAHRLNNFRPIKIPVFFAFVVSACAYLGGS